MGLSAAGRIRLGSVYASRQAHRSIHAPELCIVSTRRKSATDAFPAAIYFGSLRRHSARSAPSFRVAGTSVSG